MKMTKLLALKYLNEAKDTVNDDYQLNQYEILDNIISSVLGFPRDDIFKNKIVDALNECLVTTIDKNKLDRLLETDF